MENQEQVQGQVQEQTRAQGLEQEPFMMKPNNNMALAIFTTVCCCLPLGIVAIIKANSVESLYLAKQYNAAIMAANEAKKWSYFGIFSSLIIWVIYLLFFGGIAALSGLAALND
jgi:hypothetical protein